MHDVGILVREGTRRATGLETWGIAVEQTFIHNSQVATLSIARNQGRLVGPSENHALKREPLFVLPDQWRKLILPHDYKALVKPVEVPTTGKHAGKAKPGHYAKAASLIFVPLRLPPLGPWLQLAQDILQKVRFPVGDFAFVVELVGFEGLGLPSFPGNVVVNDEFSLEEIES